MILAAAILAAIMLPSIPPIRVDGVGLPPVIEAPSAKIFINPDFGFEMAQDAAHSGTPDFVHDGEDTALWGFSAITGARFTPDSTARPLNGTRSIETDNPNVDDVFQLQRTGTIDVADYVALTMFIYVDSDWDFDNIEIYGFDTGSSTVITSRLRLDVYFNQAEFDVWHPLVIPMADFAFVPSSFDTLRIEVMSRDGAKSPKFYIDDMQWEQLGAPISYRIDPTPGKIFLLKVVRLQITDNIATTITDGTMFGLSYNKILGLSRLPKGIGSRQTINGIVQGVALRDLSEMLLFGGEFSSVMSDASPSTTITIDFPLDQPLRLDSKTGDFAEIVIVDNMSSITHMTAITAGSEINSAP